jgi:hypothetical protein
MTIIFNNINYSIQKVSNFFTNLKIILIIYPLAFFGVYLLIYILFFISVFYTNYYDGYLYASSGGNEPGIPNTSKHGSTPDPNFRGPGGIKILNDTTKDVTGLKTSSISTNNEPIWIDLRLYKKPSANGTFTILFYDNLDRSGETLVNNASPSTSPDLIQHDERIGGRS